MIEAICAKPMRWLASIHALLKHVGEGTAPNAYKLIALSLCGPVFKAHDLLFKLSYASGTRRLRLLSRKQGLSGLQDMPLEIDLDLIDRHLKVGSAQALNDVLERFQAAKARADFRNSNHTESPS